jgi:hypothetical protein
MATLNNASTTMETSRATAESPSQQPSASPQQQKQHQKGIDIQQALSILSERSNAETSADAHNSDSTSGGCGCCHGAPTPEHAKTMGQTIDLLAENNSTKMMVVEEEDQEATSSLSKEEQEQEEQRLQEERSKERLAQIQKELNGMSDKELLQAILKAQQDRVATYREYERYETTQMVFSFAVLVWSLHCTGCILVTLTYYYYELN